MISRMEGNRLLVGIGLYTEGLAITFRYTTMRLLTAIALGSIAGCGQEPIDLFGAGQNPYATTDLTGSPNILLIVADDLGFSDIGAFGGEIDTPHIDSIASSGVSFTNFHAASSCAPSRAMLLTGVDNHPAGQGSMAFISAEQRGQPGYEDRLNNSVVSVARLLGDAGYQTYMVGKWHLGSRAGQRPHNRGFQQSFTLLGGFAAHFPNAFGPAAGSYYLNDQEISLPEDFYSTNFYTDKLIKFIENGESDRPFFAYAAYTAPHWPLQASQADVEEYQSVYDKGWDVLREARLERMQSAGVIPQGITLPKRYREVPAWHSLSKPDQTTAARKMALYAAMVKNLDANIGRLVAYLESTNRLHNTVLIFLSDNGADSFDPETSRGLASRLLATGADTTSSNMGNPGSFVTYGLPWSQLSNTPLRYFKGTAAEGGIRVPLLISWPKVFAAGKISDTFTSIMDITPSVLDLAGIQHPGKSYRTRAIHPMDGSSLLTILNGETETVKRFNPYVGFELFGHRVVFEDEWKLVSLTAPFGDGRWELYNIVDDPGESNDLAEKETERVRRMVAEYQRYAKEKGVIPPPDGFDITSGHVSLSSLVSILYNRLYAE
ncbi:MAG: arylsulfatase [Halieaceae bacterium]|nr:arylsulfatase [Halieaceae bacterium]